VRRLLLLVGLVLLGTAVSPRLRRMRRGSSSSAPRARPRRCARWRALLRPDGVLRDHARRTRSRSTAPPRCGALDRRAQLGVRPRAGGALRAALPVRAQAGIGALDGRPLGGERSFAFDTGGPGVLVSRPADSDEIDESQIFLLALDGTAEMASVADHVHCEVAGLSERIGVELVGGETREQLLAGLRVPGSSGGCCCADSASRCREGRAGCSGGGRGADPRAEVPPDAAARAGRSARVGQGQSPGRRGCAPRNEQRLGFTVRPAFRRA